MAKKSKTLLANVDDYVALDVETTGLDTLWCEVIEVSGIRYRAGVPIDRFSSLVKPRTLPIDQFIVDLTGITNEELETAPVPGDVFPRFREFLGDLPIVCHNASFDTRFLAKYFREYAGSDVENTVIDTLRICKHVFKDMQRRKLNMLVRRCEEESGDTFSGIVDAHRAESDAEAAAFCYERMKHKLTELYGDDPEAGYQRLRSSHTGYPAAKIDYDGVSPTVDEIDESNPFFGTTICFTGTLDGMTRREAVQHAVNLGARPQPGVTKKLDYLVVGSFEFNSSLHGKKSSKLRKAEGYASEGTGLQIISDRFFLSYADGE